jgi:chemotaxis protein histidine kinase CheA
MQFNPSHRLWLCEELDRGYARTYLTNFNRGTRDSAIRKTEDTLRCLDQLFPAKTQQLCAQKVLISNELVELQPKHMEMYSTVEFLSPETRRALHIQASNSDHKIRIYSLHSPNARDLITCRILIEDLRFDQISAVSGTFSLGLKLAPFPDHSAQQPLDHEQQQEEDKNDERDQLKQREEEERKAAEQLNRQQQELKEAAEAEQLKKEQQMKRLEEEAEQVKRLEQLKEQQLEVEERLKKLKKEELEAEKRLEQLKHAELYKQPKEEEEGESPKLIEEVDQPADKQAVKPANNATKEEEENPADIPTPERTTQ